MGELPSYTEGEWTWTLGSSRTGGGVRRSRIFGVERNFLQLSELTHFKPFESGLTGGCTASV